MNLAAHLLDELAALGRVIGKLLRLCEEHQQQSQQFQQDILYKLDECIQTNRAWTGSNQELLKLLTSNCEALNQLTASYNSSISLWQDWKRQPVLCEEAISSLSDGLASKLLPMLQEQVQSQAQETLQEQLALLPPLLQQLQQQMEQSSAELAVPKLLGSPPPAPTSRALTMRERLNLSAEWVRQATLPLAVLGGLLLMSGSAVGYAYAHIRQPLYVVGNTLPLSLDEAELLSWARSERGRFARALMEWNSGALDSLHCTQDVKRLGVTLEVQGRPAGYGFCTLWVVPPQKRRFLESG